MKNKLKPNDQDLFRQAMRGVKRLLATKIKISAPPPPVVRKKKAVRVEQISTENFSDFEALDPVGSEDVIEFARDGVAAKTLRSLRQGKAPLEAVLDLHGMIVAEARQALHRFLLACQAQEKVQILIVHGKGRANSKPILKNKLNHWLRQTNQVLAFCSAKPQDGGRGALYVRLKRGS